MYFNNNFKLKYNGAGQIKSPVRVSEVMHKPITKSDFERSPLPLFSLTVSCKAIENSVFLREFRLTLEFGASFVLCTNCTKLYE